MSKFNELVSKLREIFQIDRPELDFGIYRILNARAGEINDYLETRLKAKVHAALADGNAANLQYLQQELADAEKNAQSLGVSPDAVPKVQELKAKIAETSSGSAEHENAVFTHLLAFFSRYYESGDFISQRRYKGNTYAIPYAGEEVLLHWANKDQYYTKSGENFSNYTFKLDDGRKVHFRLVAADTAKDNRKDNDKERRFALIDPMTLTRMDDNGDEYEETLVPIEEIAGSDGQELVLRFEYKPMPKGTKQEALTKKAVDSVLGSDVVKAKWLDLAKRAPTEKDPQRTVLEKHISGYATKNSADYFIHKDLGGFLRCELDFYIKNEVMHLDDVQNAEKFADIEKSLRMIQCLRAIALDLVVFLAQLEDFQKKLWLKKRFVVSTNYCITVDRIDRSLYSSIADNSKQWQQWQQLGFLGDVINDDINKEDKINILINFPSLMLDTALFDKNFKFECLSFFDDIDVDTDGILIQGDNFHAFGLLKERFSRNIKCMYIDPPYNTGKDGFLYKDNYLHSSWMTFIENRLKSAENLLMDDGAIFCSIDDSEATNLEGLVTSGGSGLSMLLSFFVQVRYPNKTLSEDSDYHKTIERVLLLAKNQKQFSAIKETTPYSIEKFKWKISELSPGNMVEAGGKKVEIFMPGSYKIEEGPPSLVGLKETWATGSLARQKGSSGEFFELNLGPRKGIDGLGVVYKVYGIGEDGLGYRYFSGPRRDDANKGKFYSGIPLSTLEELKNGTATKDLPIANFDDFSGDFGNCRHEGLVDISGGKKPERFIQKFINLASKKGTPDIVADPFAGSGTTPSVALQMGKKFIAVEVSEYFKTKVIPRMQRAYFGVSAGINNSPKSGMFKYFEIESYEDTLNNLQLIREAKQGETLALMPEDAKDDYLLRYMLDVESRGSLLSIESFKKPFDVSLKVSVDSAGAYEVRKVDLVETFNYLIGLRVKHIDAQMDRGFVTVSGTLPSGESALVLWRDCEVLDYEALAKLCDRLAINPKDNEFDVVYINGDHNIPTVLTQTQEEGGATRVLKLRQIEPEFLERMFSVENI